MAQNIRDFYRVAQQRDFARVFQFRVTQLGPSLSLINEDDLIYLETASLPGRAITNVPVPYMGLSFNVPGTASYPGSAGYNVTFRCDAAYDIRSKLEQLTFRTFNDDTSTGEFSIPGEESILQLDLFTSGSRTDTAPTLVRRYKLYGMYVVSLGDVSHTITDTRSVAMVNAVLAYQYWRAFNTADRTSDGVDRTVPNTFSGGGEFR